MEERVQPDRREWSRTEVEAIVDDYLSMLSSELAGTSYSKSAHRRALKTRLSGRSDPSIEFKHANISAALIDAGMPYIDGYKPRSNYQSLLAEVIAERIERASGLLHLAEADAERPTAVPEVDDILSILTEPPAGRFQGGALRVSRPPAIRLPTNYLERESRNRSLGAAGELFVLNFERARLIHAGMESLAGRIEHTAVVRGDQEGYDILSFEANGAERLIEVKTTKYGIATPFFVSRNELSVSEQFAPNYQVYRLFGFQRAPRMFTLPGPISSTCAISATSYLATPK
jgi:hypothetical protein